MPVHVRFTPQLRRFLEAPPAEVEGATPREALEQVFDQNPRLRAYLLDEQGVLRKHVALDSFGKCLHNNGSCAKAGKHKCERVDLAGSYRFVFAFENVEESHYVTEKVE